MFHAGIAYLYLKFKNKYNILPEIHMTSSGKNRVFSMCIEAIFTKSLKTK